MNKSITFIGVIVLILAIICTNTYANTVKLDQNTEKSLITSFKNIVKNDIEQHQHLQFDPRRLYEQKDFLFLLGATGTTTQSSKVCQNIQTVLENATTTLSAERVSDIIYSSKLITMYNCQTIQLTPLMLDLLDVLVLSDSLVEIHAGIELFIALDGVKALPDDYNSERYDWVDILDLLSSLHLSDGLTRSTVSTLAPSIRNTLTVIDLGSKIDKLLTSQQKSTYDEKITSYLTATTNAINKIVSGLCDKTVSATAAFGLQEYSDFFTSVESFPLTNKGKISSPLQCIVSQSQSTLFTTQFTSAYHLTRFNTVVMKALESSKVFTFTDLFTPSTIYYLTTPSALNSAQPQPENIKITATAVKIVGLFKYEPVNTFKSDTKFTITLTPATSSKPIASTTTTLDALISSQGVEAMTSFEDKKSSVFGRSVFTVIVNNTVVYTSTVTITATNQGPTFITSISKDKFGNDVKMVIDGDVKNAIALSSSHQPTTIDLTTKRQIEVKIKTDKANLYTLRLVSCQNNNVKTCVDNIQQNNEKINNENSVGVIFPIKTETANTVALYFTAPNVKKFIQNQKDIINTSFIVLLDQTVLQTSQSTSTFAGAIKFSISDNTVFDELFGTKINPSAHQTSYLWSIVEHHFHTFNSPHRIANPFISTVFIAIVLGISAVFIIAFLFVFKPIPNITSALASINFLIFSGSLGAILLAILFYWFKLTLFQAATSAAIVALPFSIAIYLPLKESVSSLRLYDLLYKEQPQQITKKEKKD